MAESTASAPDWARLQEIALAEVERTLASLPQRLRDSMRAVPVIFEPRPADDLVADGVAADSLGLFVGDPLGEDRGDGLPPQIILYLESLFEFAEGDVTIYREEIQTTLLHEIGHYLGLDELDLEDRDLA